MEYTFLSPCKVSYHYDEDDGEPSTGDITRSLVDCINSEVENSLEEGLATYIDESLDVTNVKITVEMPTKDYPYGYAPVKTVVTTARDLSPSEIGTLVGELSGQFSDGWGEGFEQSPVDSSSDRIGGSYEVYVNFWFSSRGSSVPWSMEPVS